MESRRPAEGDAQGPGDGTEDVIVPDAVSETVLVGTEAGDHNMILGCCKGIADMVFLVVRHGYLHVTWRIN